jgi:4-hydroxyphenylpyruvate dioxygenase
MSNPTASLMLEREQVAEVPNLLGIEGIEFVEYTTPHAQALGRCLEAAGFRPVARHRSREVVRYRQGAMNVVVNAHATPGTEGAQAGPAIAAVALRVRDAGEAWRRCVDRGAWPVPPKAMPMELHIPAVHGPGASRLYFVDRWREFSIFDVDFVPIPTVQAQVPAVESLHWFGVVQYVGAGRTVDWIAFYGELLGFAPLPPRSAFGALPSGRILRSPCGTFYWQLIEPGAAALEGQGDEYLQRVAFGTPAVGAAVKALAARGLEFAPPEALAAGGERGALSRAPAGGVMFEFVQHEAADA